MRCPYCVSEIADEALACPNCAHDLYLFKPLLEKIGELEKLRTSAEARIVALEAELGPLKVKRTNEFPTTRTAKKAPGYAAAVLQSLIPALLLLALAHWVMLFIYDIKPLYLRIATILIPVPFGFLLASRFLVGIRTSVLAASTLAFASVFSMLALTAAIDKVPLFPQDLRDLRETLEYVLSIALAFVTGLLLGKYRARHQLAELKSNSIATMMARALVPNEEGSLGIEVMVQRLRKLQEAATTTAVGAASVYAGLKTFLGGPG